MKNSNALLTQASNLTLTFQCRVQPGEGRFSRMVFPGRNDMKGASADWPDKLQPGSLNCKIDAFPENYVEIVGPGDRIAALDSGRFTPAMTIPADMITNNVLNRPGHPDPRFGMAQAWRVSVRQEDSGETFDAWHVRRVDGTYPPFHGTMELMADRKLRDAHALRDGTRLTITMQAGENLTGGPKAPESGGRSFLRRFGLGG